MIVFLHGWGMSRFVFEQFVDDYLKEEETLLLNLPGYDVEDYESDISFDEEVNALKQQIPQGAHVVAWSLGGLYALRINQLFPGLIAKITLVCSTPSFTQRDHFSDAMSSDLLSQFALQLQQNRKKTIARFFMLQVYAETNAKQIVAKLNKQVHRIHEPSAVVLAKGLEYLLNIDCRLALSESTIPVYFVLGKNDRLVPYQVKKDLLSMNTMVSVSIIDGCAHLPFVSHAEEFNQLVF